MPLTLVPTVALDEKADLCIDDIVEIGNPVITGSEFAYKVRIKGLPSSNCLSILTGRLKGHQFGAHQRRRRKTGRKICQSTQPYFRSFPCFQCQTA